ncbi:hypothetical protein ThvES_00002400 [Thiovulum sp. ES]|jgi:hypothetical protein|nr:hypothetical protein ThvES_00002400 [Thiovulum sp. ES]
MKMYIKRYSFFAMFFLVLVGWAIYTFVTQSSTGTIEIYNGQYTLPDLPIAIAIMIPAVALFLFSLGHLMFYGMINYFHEKAEERDLKKLENTIEMNLKRKETSSIQYKTSQYRDIGELITLLKLQINSADGLSKKNIFRPLIEKIVALQNGEIVEVESGSGFHLKELNRRNALQFGDGNPEEIIMEHGYSDKLYIQAFNRLCRTASLQTIEKYDKWLNIEGLFNILSRVDEEENGITLTLDKALELVEKLNFSKENYLKMASVVKDSNMSPDFRIDFFKQLSDKHEDAFESYLYTLLHLEMTGEVEELIRDHGNSEFNHIRAYIILKQTDHTLLDIDFFFKR